MKSSIAEMSRDELEKQNFDLVQLLEISKSLNSTLDYGILIESILYTIMGQMKVLRAALYVRKGIESRRFVLHRNSKGFEIDRNTDYGVEEASPAMRLLASEPRCWTLDEVAARLGGLDGFSAMATLSPCLVVPLMAKGSIQGLVLLGEQIIDEGFCEDDKDYLLNIAMLAATAIHNAFLFEMTTTDMMTLLRMKHYFMAVLSEKMEQTAFGDRPLAVIMADVDHFKKFNDTYGHACGDDVLRSVAGILSAQTRAGDVAARYGGEEFCMLLPDTTVQAAMAIAERIRTSVANRHVEYDGMCLSVTLSLGVAAYDPARDLSPLALVDRADKALYVSKQTGRNRVTAAP